MPTTPRAHRHVATDGPASAAPLPRTYVATWTVSDGEGPGEYKIQLPPDCDLNDLAALRPIIEAIKRFTDIAQPASTGTV